MFKRGDIVKISKNANKEYIEKFNYQSYKVIEFISYFSSSDCFLMCKMEGLIDSRIIRMEDNLLEYDGKYYRKEKLNIILEKLMK
jgi:hypothetical protein